MAPVELPIKCENCGSEDLVHGLKFGKLNGAVGNTGGPGQEPMPIGNQWAVYMCPQCSAIFPYKKHYVGSPAVVAQYQRVHQFFKERMERMKKAEEVAEKLESVRAANKTLATLPSLPGSLGSNEQAISNAIAPLIAKINAMDEELKKRRGGRPPGKGKKKEIDGE